MNENEELQDRFEGVARGRAVSVRFEAADFILALDYKVAFVSEAGAFEVSLRRGGCFERAYRCIERWIEAKAEELDGIDSVPFGYVDYRDEMQYWGIEKVYEQFRADLESAVAEKVLWLEQIRPGEGVSGEVVVEARVSNLRGVLTYLQRADTEVRRGVLSPNTIELWKNIGLDVMGEGG